MAGLVPELRAGGLNTRIHGDIHQEDGIFWKGTGLGGRWEMLFASVSPDMMSVASCVCESGSQRTSLDHRTRVCKLSA